MKHKLLMFLLNLCSTIVAADSIAHFIGISQNIPRMEMKADANSQAWARSARNILLLTGESIWESLQAANQHAEKLGRPLFCIPEQQTITAEAMYDLIEKTYASMKLSAAEQNNISVGQIALSGLQQSYPCAMPELSAQQITIKKHGEGIGQKIMHVSKI